MIKQLLLSVGKGEVRRSR